MLRNPTFIPAHERRITTILFDLDDTLLDWSEAKGVWEGFLHQRAQGVYSYLVEMGYSVPAHDEFAIIIRQQIKIIWDEARNTLGGASLTDALHRTLAVCEIDPAGVNIHALLEAYGWDLIPGVRPFADTHSTLETLRQQGYQLGLITNTFTPMWMRDKELQALGLLDYFPVRVTSGDTGYIKPHPAIFWRALGALGALPERSVYVGDRPANDIVGAKEVGMVSVLMSPAHVIPLQQEWAGVPADYTINSLSELLPLLESIRNES